MVALANVRDTMYSTDIADGPCGLWKGNCRALRGSIQGSKMLFGGSAIPTHVHCCHTRIISIHFPQTAEPERRCGLLRQLQTFSLPIQDLHYSFGGPSVPPTSSAQIAQRMIRILSWIFTGRLPMNLFKSMCGFSILLADESHSLQTFSLNCTMSLRSGRTRPPCRYRPTRGPAVEYGTYNLQSSPIVSHMVFRATRPQRFLRKI
jgi:hypothetical protein